MRKGFETVAAIVREQVEFDPLSGVLCLFTNKQRTQAKVIYFDGSGMCLFSKRLSRRASSSRCGNARCNKLSKRELDLFLESSRLIGRLRVALAPIEQ